MNLQEPNQTKRDGSKKIRICGFFILHVKFYRNKTLEKGGAVCNNSSVSGDPRIGCRDLFHSGQR